MKKSELREIIREELLNEGLYQIMSDMDKGMEQLVKGARSGDTDMFDKRSIASSSDGELVAQVLKPWIQGWAIKLKDPKGFWKKLK